jgi:hypothetical protein
VIDFLALEKVFAGLAVIWTVTAFIFKVIDFVQSFNSELTKATLNRLVRTEPKVTFVGISGHAKLFTFGEFTAERGKRTLLIKMRFQFLELSVPFTSVLMMWTLQLFLVQERQGQIHVDFGHTSVETLATEGTSSVGLV